MQCKKDYRWVAAFVPDGAKLLDVGSDHALSADLPGSVGRIEKALAGEVVEGAFFSVCSEKCGRAWADGSRLRSVLPPVWQFWKRKIRLTPSNVIAGMGGRLIRDLENGRAKLGSVSRLWFCSPITNRGMSSAAGLYLTVFVCWLRIS